MARHSDADAVVRMGRDLVANGQLQHVAAVDTGRLIFGHGRYLAAKAAGLETLRVNVYPLLTDLQFTLLRAAENLQRRELRDYQRYEIVAGLLAGQPGWQQKDAAAALNLSPSTVTQLMTAGGKSTEAVRRAFEEGRIGVSVAYKIAQKPAAVQDGLLALTLGQNLSRDAIERAARPPKPDAVRLGRVRLTVNGLSLVLTGADLSLSDVADVLAQAQREVRRAVDQGMDVRALNALHAARKAAAAS